jgi:hypothetical protein
MPAPWGAVGVKVRAITEATQVVAAARGRTQILTAGSLCGFGFRFFVAAGAPQATAARLWGLLGAGPKMGLQNQVIGGEKRRLQSVRWGDSRCDGLHSFVSKQRAAAPAPRRNWVWGVEVEKQSVYERVCKLS